MNEQKFAWTEENTAAAVAAYQNAIAAQGCEAANSDEALNVIAASVGAKNANSMRRKLQRLARYYFTASKGKMQGFL